LRTRPALASYPAASDSVILMTNPTVLQGVDDAIVVAAIVYFFYKYGRQRVPVKDRKVTFFISLAIMIHFFIQAGVNASTSDRTDLFYISLIGAAATLCSVIYALSTRPRHGFCEQTFSREL
jgi:hypothetical protein